MKICFVSEPLHAGVGRYVVDAVSELARRGHEIHLLYSPIRVEPRFLAALKQLPNVHCEAIPMPREIGFGDIRAFFAVRAYMRANGPFDAVHGCSSKGGGYARLLKLFGHGPVVYSPQAFVTLSPVVRGFKRRLYRMLEANLAKVTGRIICASRAEAEHAEELGISPRRLTVIANGTPALPMPSRDCIRAELGLPPDAVVMGFVGRMEDQKAPERLVSIAHRLLPELPQLRLVMIGDGPKRPALQRALECAGLEKRVFWLGAVDARRYLPAMDIFVLPSLYEGFAYVLIEALQAGLPIVSTPVGGALESISSGENGFVVPHDSHLAMANAIRTLAADDDLRQRMGRASLCAAERFSVGAMVDAMEALYASLPLPAERIRERTRAVASASAG